MRQLPIVYSQRDPKWASQRLGTVNGTTIGAEGCFTTSLAMLANYYGHPVTPAQLDDLFTNGDTGDGKKTFYADGNLCTDDILQKVFADCVYQKTYNYASTAADLNQLKTLLSDPTLSVVLELDFDHDPNDGIQTHFVVAVDCDGTNVTIADPWPVPGSIDPFAKNYGSNPAQTILKYVVYKGTPAPITGTNAGGPNMYKGLDLSNPASMKVAVDIWDAVVNQKQYVGIDKYNADLAAKQKAMDILTGNITADQAALDAIAVVLAMPTGSKNEDIIAAIKTLQTTSGTVADWETKATDPTSGKLYKDLYAQLESDVNTPVTGLQAQLTTAQKSNAQLKNTSYTTAATKVLINEIIKRAANKITNSKGGAN